jgi:uncharacterized protein YecT (DUF1311 family)
MKKYWVLLMGMILGGCGDDISKIKYGVMDFNKTITVGDALDNWKSCEAGHWRKFLTDNNTRVVEFECQHKITEYFRKLKALNTDKANEIYIDVVSNKQYFQFTLNKDDSFQIHSVETETVWRDGTSQRIRREPIDVLKDAYANSMNFDPDLINSELSKLAIGIYMSIKPGSNIRGNGSETATNASGTDELDQSDPVTSNSRLALPNSFPKSGPISPAEPKSQFNCIDAGSYVENQVCNDRELRAQNEKLLKTYRKILDLEITDEIRSKVEETQVEWVAERDKCADRSCIVSSYAHRFEDLCKFQTSGELLCNLID